MKTVHPVAPDGGFTAVAWKTLARVDLPGAGSHQHEINGVASLRGFFQAGASHEGEIRWVYLSDASEPETALEPYRFYDARARGAGRTGRSEWRLYYAGDFLVRACAGDLLLLTRDRDRRVRGLVLAEGSSWWLAVHTQLGLGERASRGAELLPPGSLHQQQRELLRLLRELDAAPAPALDDELAKLAAHELSAARDAGLEFPATQRLATVARTALPWDPDSADETFLAWLDKEEEIFLAIEQLVVGGRAVRGFAAVDEFTDYALSVLNRRKSRRGLSVQNHLAAVFDAAGLRYDAQAATEQRNKPDFLFPGKREYSDLNYPPSRLFMLAAKSTCKERWRQILTEADRIPVKHLCTLDQSISEAQIKEMRRQRVVLVIPAPHQASFPSSQRQGLWTLARFVAEAGRSQHGTRTQPSR